MKACPCGRPMTVVASEGLRAKLPWPRCPHAAAISRGGVGVVRPLRRRDEPPVWLGLVAAPLLGSTAPTVALAMEPPLCEESHVPPGSKGGIPPSLRHQRQYAQRRRCLRW